jgi:hypothetical protein
VVEPLFLPNERELRGHPSLGSEFCGHRAIGLWEQIQCVKKGKNVLPFLEATVLSSSSPLMLSLED